MIIILFKDFVNKFTLSYVVQCIAIIIQIDYNIIIKD